ncbi:MAG TPA: hypothetical protein VLE91_05090 [Candidatus Saccharimonadales bacterium]|nr:hypothetical protein [Candidatus Saccharimonadales bacterium]
MALIIPGILTDKEEEYKSRLQKADHAAPLIQIDLVDGKFANSTTVGAGVIKKYPTKNPLEIQLMVVDPINYIDDLSKLEFVTKIIFPYEIDGDVLEVAYLIRRLGKSVGLSLNPTTPVQDVLHYFDDIDMLLLMTGNPGFSGQKLGTETYQRIKDAKKINDSLPVEIDIGVNFKNAKKLADAGADFLVSSSALYNEPDFSVAYEKMQKIVNN